MQVRNYIIGENDLGDLSRKVEKLNKRAVKLGLDPLVLTVTGEKFVTVTTDRQGNEIPPYQKRLLVVEIAGNPPKLNGWQFVAVIEHQPEGNIIRIVPPFETQSVGPEFRTCAPNCDHCGLDRRRNDTYIVQNEDGRRAQVGRTCLKDFTGHPSPEAAAEFVESFGDLDDFVEGFGGGGERYYGVQTVAALAASVIRQDGFISSKRAKEDYSGQTQPTSAFISYLLTDKKVEKEVREQYDPAPKDRELAEKAIEWASSLPADITNDYLWNLKVISSKDAITLRHIGLITSLVPAYQREVEHREKQSQEFRESHYVGTVGKREEFTITLRKVVPIDGNYGTSYLHIFEDQSGNRLSWFSSNAPTTDENHTYHVKATVKAHEPYKGIEQTKLARVAILNEVATAQTAEA